MRPFRRLAAVVLAVFLLTIPTYAQTTEADDPVDIVLQAVQNLAELEGYHFTLTSESYTHITQTDVEAVTVYNYAMVEGDVNADGDYHLLRSLSAGASPEEARSSDPLQIERTLVDDVAYVNLDIEDTPYQDMIDIEPGWWLYDDLVDRLDGTYAVIIDNPKPETLLPSNLLLTEQLITHTSELPAEEVDGIALQGYELQLNGALFMTLQTPGTIIDQMRALVENSALFAASDIEYTYQLWIGVEDDLLHRVSITANVSIPYGTVGGDNDPNYDYALEATSEYTISAHGEPVEITAPAESLLND